MGYFLLFGPLAGYLFAIFGKVLLWKWSHGLWDHFTVLVEKWIWLGNYQSDLRFLGCTPFLWFHVWSSEMIIMHADHACSSYISIKPHHQIWSWYLIIKVYHHGLWLHFIIQFEHHRLSSSFSRIFYFPYWTSCVITKCCLIKSLNRSGENQTPLRPWPPRNPCFIFQVLRPSGFEN